MFTKESLKEKLIQKLKEEYENFINEIKDTGVEDAIDYTTNEEKTLNPSYEIEDSKEEFKGDYESKYEKLSEIFWEVVDVEHYNMSKSEKRQVEQMMDGQFDEMWNAILE